MKRRYFLSVLCVIFLMSNFALAQERSFVLATTTSTENSGLLDVLIPQFTASTGIKIDVVAVGTGQALALGKRGDAAALLTHDRAGEDAFIEGGYGADRRDAMYNDFIIIGPEDDPANVSQAQTARQALSNIAQTKSLFASRGDDSGTNRKELRLWAEIGITPDLKDDWYRETGSGMGQTIITATQMDAYTLADRATWIKFAQKAHYVIAFEGDPPLHNPYSSVLVTNAVIPEDEHAAANDWHEWLTGAEGQKAINDFRIDGQQVFFVN